MLSTQEMPTGFIPIKWTEGGLEHDYSNYTIGEHEGQVTVKNSKGNYLKSNNQSGRVRLVNGDMHCMMTPYRLWLYCTVGSPPIDSNGNRYTADHIDRDHTNNSVNNLRWASMILQARNQNKRDIKSNWQPCEPPDNVKSFTFSSGSELFFSRDGNAYRKDTVLEGQWLQLHGSKAGNGYITICNVRRNRLIVHLYPEEYGSFDLDSPMVVDHINEIKTDDRRDNLRVCTMSENSNAHYERGMSSYANSVICYKVDDFETRTNGVKYVSVSAACRDLGLGRHRTDDAIRLNKNIDGWRIVFEELESRTCDA